MPMLLRPGLVAHHLAVDPLTRLRVCLAGRLPRAFAVLLAILELASVYGVLPLFLHKLVDALTILVAVGPLPVVNVAVGICDRQWQ